MTLNKEEFCFDCEIDRINTIIGVQCKEKGIHYEYRSEGEIDDYYIGDAMKLKQVMINILGNAVKFTPEGGSIRFLVEGGRDLITRPS